jgi:hypothetical protein
MPSIEVLLEGERRGLLDEGNKTLLAEARRRGLAPGGETGPAAPTMNFDLTELPGRVLSGITNIPSAAYNMVAGPLSAYKTMEIGSEASQPKTLAEADKFYNQRAVAPRAIGTAEGLASGAALGIPSRFLPETTNEDRLAARELGGAIGGTVTGGLGLKELAKRGFGSVAKFIGLPAAMSAAEPLSRLDIPGAVESATTGAGLGGAAKLAGSVASPLIERYSPAAKAIRAQNEALGGGKGVLNELNKQVTTSKTPDLVPESYTTPTSVMEAGETLHNQSKVAGDVARATMSDRLQNEVFKLAPEDAVAPNSYIEKFKTLATEGPEALRNTVQRKLGKVAAEASPEEGVNSGWVNKAVQMWEGVDDNTLKQIKSIFNNTDEGQNPATFRNLIKLHQELGQISGNDSVIRVVKTAKQAVEHDINELGKQYPDAVRAWRMWNKDYARDVGQYYNSGAPLRELTNESFGRPDIPNSEKIPKLAAMAPEKAQNIMQGLRQGPAGQAAVDNVSAGAWQHLLEKHQTAFGTNFKGLVEDLSKPQQRRTWEAILGPRFETAMKLKNTLVDTGLSNYGGGDPRAVSMASNFHTIYGGAQLLGGAAGIGGNPMSALYHLGSAAYMKIKPEMAARILNDKMGARLLAAGLLEKPGTPKANTIISKLGEVIDRVGPEPQKPGGGGAAGPISDAEIVGPPALPMPGSGISKSAASSAEVFNDAFKQGQSSEGAAALRVRMNAEAQKAARYGDLVNPITDVPFSRAQQSAQAIQEAELARKAFLQSPQGKESLAQSLRAKQAAMKGKFADTDQLVQDLRNRFVGDNSFGPNLEEHTALTDILRDKTAPANLKDMARSVLQRYPKPVIPPLIPDEALRARIKAIGNEVLGPASDEAAPLTKLAVEPHPADVIRARDKANVEAFQSKGPKTGNDAELNPVQLMNKITVDPRTKVRSKFLVRPEVMSQLESGYKTAKGESKASQWFTDEPGPNVQNLDEAIGLFSEYYGIEPDYNAFRAHLDNAFDAYKPKERQTQIRRKGDTRTAKEKAQAAQIIAEKKR